MSGRRRAGLARASRFWYRFLLLAYPRPFRVLHGDDAADVFADLARATRRRGHAALTALWIRSIPAVLRGAFEERRQARRLPAPVTPAMRTSGAASGPPSGRHHVDGPARRWSFDTLSSEVRQSVRGLARRPAFAAAVIVTLALGIGATTAVFSVVDTVLLNPLPFRQAERLIVVGHAVPKIASGEWGLSQAGYFYFREHAGSLEDVGAYWGTSRVITGDGPPERLQVTAVTASVLSTLGVVPEIGRPIIASDDRPGAAAVVLLSHGLWVRSFGADPTVVGRHIFLSGDSYEVVGVMPASFRFPSPRSDAWVPARFDPAATPINQHTFPGIARLRAGVSVEDARTELQALVGRFAEELPTAYGNGFIERSGFQVVTRSLLDDTVGSVRTLLWIVFAAAVVVLVVACSNVANLMLLRSEGRRREIAVRAALGASSGALFRYSVWEAGLLAVTGGALGAAVAWVAVRMLVLSAPAGVPRLDEIAMRPEVGLVALTVIAIVSLVLGAASARRGRSQLIGQLGGGGRSGSVDRQRLRLRGAFVVTQVAMAVLLLTGSGVLLRSFLNLRAVDPGFSPENVLTVQLTLSGPTYDDAAAFRFFEEVGERLRALPGVTAVGAVTDLPLASRAADNATGVADLPDGSEQTMLIDTKFAGPGYFEALGMRLLEGRTFERRDMDEGTPGAVVTRALAEELWPGESAIGRRVRPLLREYPWHRVVGVIENVHTEDIATPPEPTVYFPYVDLPWFRSFSFAIRTAGPPGLLLSAVRREVRALDDDVPLAAVTTMAELMADHLSHTTFTLTLLGAAAAMALFLCAVGIYGVIGYAVRQRRFEIGIRVALGARAGQVAGMVIGQTMGLAATGIVIGIGLALAGMGLMESLLFEVTGSDPPTLAAVAVGLALVAALAGALPARRATRVDAIVALQGE